jgi:RimJ/RimL family protein N-acetyltransferase
MVNAATPLNDLLRLLAPRLHEGTFAFCLCPRNAVASWFEPVATFHEPEGCSIIVAESTAKRAHLPILFRAAWITLHVRSELHAVGLTAAVATALAEAGIACNVVAAVSHDHLFVPADSADRALAILHALQRSAEQEGSTPVTETTDHVNVLETPRLILRRFTAADAAFIHELVNEPDWKRFIGDKGVDSLDAARRYIENGPVAAYRRHGFGLFAMQRKADAALVGMCGLIKRETLDDIDLGFALLARHAGQGLAHEAAQATLTYARDTLGLARVVAITDADNARSEHLLEKLGMRYERTLCLAPDDEVLLYARALNPNSDAVPPHAEHSQLT